MRVHPSGTAAMDAETGESAVDAVLSEEVCSGPPDALL